MSRLLMLFSQITSGELEIPKGEVGPSNVDNVLGIVFAVAGAIALLIITLSALRYVLSQGDPQSTAKAKNGIMYALIGLIVVVFAVAIVAFVSANI